MTSSASEPTPAEAAPAPLNQAGPSPAAAAIPAPVPAAEARSSPVLQLLAGALRLWLRQQCEVIESLDIQLEGSTLALLRGRIEGVRVLARRVVYQGLEIEQVELCSEPIQVQVGRLLKGRSLELEQPFAIQGQVGFSADGLTRSLAQPQWRSLGDALGEALLGIAPLSELRLQADRLVLSACSLAVGDRIELEAHLLAREGTVEIRACGGEVATRLPMDPNVRIEQAGIEGGLVRLAGRARVSP